jgi:cobyrinic acid a,c-diamide synthase
VDFKFVDLNGTVLATAGSAREARAMRQAANTIFALHILLDDTGMEISEADLGVFCAAEIAGTPRNA